MKITKFEQVEINDCADCPYYYEDHDMCVSIPCCSLLSDSHSYYDDCLGDLNWKNNHEKISKRCPYTKEYDKEVWHNIMEILVNR